jgi:hypothetical protein
MAQPNQELESLLNNYRAELRPSSTHEEMLVRDVAVSDWRLQQITRIEIGLMSALMQEVYSHMLNAGKPAQCEYKPEDFQTQPLSEENDQVKTMMMGAAWAANPAAFSLLVRYQARARRDYYAALKQLELVRTGKAGYLPKPEPVKNQTKPTPPPQKPAPVASANQTNPNVAGFRNEPEPLKSSDSQSTGESREIRSSQDDNSDFMTIK